MAKLTTTQRKRLPKSEFAGPGRSYPVNDKEHARKAIQLSARGVKAGNISESTREKIVSKAKRMLGESGKGATAMDAAARAMARKRK